MEDSDIVELEDLAHVRHVTKRLARRMVLGHAVAILVFAAAAFALVYAIYGSERIVAGYVSAAMFSLLVLYQLIRWSRHYQSIDAQLVALELRVKNGERIYGSQVKFSA